MLMTSSGTDILVRSSFRFNPRQEPDVEKATYHLSQPPFKRSARFQISRNHPTYVYLPTLHTFVIFVSWYNTGGCP